MIRYDLAKVGGWTAVSEASDQSPILACGVRMSDVDGEGPGLLVGVTYGRLEWPSYSTRLMIFPDEVEEVT
jgi:hypothetical protein